MTINIVSKGIKLTDAFKKIVEDGIGGLESRFKGSPTCKVTIKPAENDTVKVSILVYAGKYVFKGEDTAKSRNIAFGHAIRDIERSLNKTKTKQLMKRYMPDEIRETIIEEDVGESEVADVKEFITTKKDLRVLPMNIDEAYMQMELIGHTFFAFINDTNGLINILYRKRSNDESYGIIELRR